MRAATPALVSSFSDSSSSSEGSLILTPSRSPTPPLQTSGGGRMSTALSSLTVSHETHATSNDAGKYYRIQSAGAKADNSSEHDHDVRWVVTSIQLRDSSPFFSVDVGPIIWEVADVMRANKEYFLNFCAWYQNWKRLLTRPAEHSVPFKWPILPPRLIPGECVSLEILDTVLWNGKWMVLIAAKMLIRFEDIGSHASLLQAALAYMQSGDFQVGTA